MTEEEARFEFKKFWISSKKKEIDEAERIIKLLCPNRDLYCDECEYFFSFHRCRYLDIDIPLELMCLSPSEKKHLW